MPEEFFSNEAHATHGNFTKLDGHGGGRTDSATAQAAELIRAIHRPIRPALSGHFVFAKRIDSRQ
jgi:hypothetical protein